jgi:hypothetical protein
MLKVNERYARGWKDGYHPLSTDGKREILRLTKCSDESQAGYYDDIVVVIPDNPCTVDLTGLYC